MSLLAHRTCGYAQWGEDGILRQIFSDLGIPSGYFVEFGAGDGVQFSMTRALSERGWGGLVLECNERRFGELLKNQLPGTLCLKRRVTVSGPDSVDGILDELRVKSVQFLSIDVDGLDYWIFQSLRRRPLCVAVEINNALAWDEPPVPVETALVGQSLGTMTTLAQQMGYALVCHSGNAIYVLQEQLGPLPAMDPHRAYMDYLASIGSFVPGEVAYLKSTLSLMPFRQRHNEYLET